MQQLPILKESGVMFKNRTDRWYCLESFPDEDWVDFPPIRGMEFFSEGYMISNYGRLKAKEKQQGSGIYRGASHICRTGLNKCGYEMIRLTYRGVSKTIRIHRIVAFAFLSNPNNFREVNHKNEIKTDNRAINLEWCSRSYNMKYGKGVKEGQKKIVQSPYFRNLLKPVNKYDLNGNYIQTYSSISEAARDIGKPGAKSVISQSCKGKLNYSYGFKWKYKKDADS